MISRMIQIYTELYTEPQSKEYFATLFNITTKSIENATKKYKDDIVFDRKLSKYRFRDLLPKFIPLEVFFTIFQDSIANQVIKNDILSVGQLFSSHPEAYIHMIETRYLSILSQRIIMGNIAIKHNCMLKIEYTGNNNSTETKYIRPQKVTSTGYIYYLYASYDKKNKKNIGKNRSFAFNSIHGMEAIEYLKDISLSVDGKGNAYGIINKEKYVLLRLESNAASFFKREQQFKREEYEFISENVNGEVFMKMYYNNIDEIRHLVQGWMPQISIEGKSKEKTIIYEKIKSSCENLLHDDDEYEVTI